METSHIALLAAGIATVGGLVAVFAALSAVRASKRSQAADGSASVVGLHTAREGSGDSDGGDGGGGGD